MPPPDVQLPRALQAFRPVSDHLLHPLVVASLGAVLTRPAADAALKVQPLTLREAAAALAKAAPDLARGTSVARPWQDGRQARCTALFPTGRVHTPAALGRTCESHTMLPLPKKHECHASCSAHYFVVEAQRAGHVPIFRYEGPHRESGKVDAKR